MSIFEFSSIIVAIVVGLAIANVLDKFSHTIKVTHWIRQGWFQSMLCILVLIMMLGYFWGFWGMFYDITEIGLLEFMLGPFISVVLHVFLNLIMKLLQNNFLSLLKFRKKLHSYHNFRNQSKKFLL